MGNYLQQDAIRRLLARLEKVHAVHAALLVLDPGPAEETYRYARKGCDETLWALVAGAEARMRAAGSGPSLRELADWAGRPVLLVGHSFGTLAGTPRMVAATEPVEDAVLLSRLRHELGETAQACVRESLSPRWR